MDNDKNVLLAIIKIASNKRPTSIAGEDVQQVRALSGLSVQDFSESLNNLEISQLIKIGWGSGEPTYIDVSTYVPTHQ
ncbi:MULTISPECIES: hypothetical protein [unclassified Levilactobacillus]|uniref:hypothetical protein n=1 Tax=unclassified Levilactobacillus TaxID=2767918 RepID=UPI002FEE7854